MWIFGPLIEPTAAMHVPFAMRARLPLLGALWLLASCLAPRGVRKAELISAGPEEARVRLSGNIMLDGGCSPQPLWSLEQRTDAGWTVRVPFPGAQLLCGAGSWVYRRQEFDLPMGTTGLWNHPQARGPLAPGTYRLVFKGPNGRLKRTERFSVGPSP